MFSDYFRWFFVLLSGQRTATELRTAAKREEDVKNYINVEQSLDVLDVGNGRLRPQHSILAAQGHNVVGVDLVNGEGFSLKNLIYFFARIIYKFWINPKALFGTKSKLLNCNVEQLPFADDSFDLITSNAAFEHFLDVPKVLKELRRVTKPGGMLWINFHNFTSLSGGHNLTKRLKPVDSVNDESLLWDHLRSRKLPFSVPLNEWRISQYLEAFGDNFEIVEHRCGNKEGEDLLSEDLLKELATYSKDELLCANYIIVARNSK